MEVVKNILINYWQVILSAILFIISFILQIKRKKPISSILQDIFVFALQAVTNIENEHVLGGANKLSLAVAFVCQKLKDKYPDLTPLQYKDEIVCVIENILSTPQKKGN